MKASPKLRVGAATDKAVCKGVRIGGDLQRRNLVEGGAAMCHKSLLLAGGGSWLSDSNIFA
jgi:hypothetical protein